LLVPKLLLGNRVFEAPASLRTAKLEFARKEFPSRKSRRFGRDAEIQAMDGN